MSPRPLVICAASLVAVASAGAVAQSVNEDFKVVASDGNPDDEFGKRVAIGSGKVVVGAAFSDKAGANSGTVYTYSAFTGAETLKIRAANAAPYDTLGSSVGVDGNLIVAGAMNADRGGLNKTGAAYLFDATSGAQLHELTPSFYTPSGQFGNACAIDGSVVAVGAHRYGFPGLDAGYVFLFDATSGLGTVALTPSDGASEDQFGYDVALEGSTVVVGAIRDDDNGNNSGSAYVFDATTGVQMFKLTASDGSAQDLFGSSVAIRNGIIAVGAYLDDDVEPNSGSVYLFDAATGAQIAKVTSPLPHASAWFGFDVGLDDDTLIVSSGKFGAFTFDVATGASLDHFYGSDTIATDSFGFASAIWEGIAVVGSFLDDNANGADAGSAYVFDFSCPADLNGNNVTDSADLSIFLTHYGNGDPEADWNHDGAIDYFDVASFNADLNGGCPHS